MQNGADFEGLVAIVTGGSSGIGAATAAELAGRGATAVSLDLHPPAAGASSAYEHVDIADPEATTAAVDAVAWRFGGVDVLINNAGIPAIGTIETNPMEEWHRVFAVNLFGVVHASRAAVPHLRRSRSAAVVNVGSIAAVAGLPERAIYSAAKGGVQALSLAMAADLVREGIRVNCVSPGTAETPFVTDLLAIAPDPTAQRRSMESRQPIGRLVSAGEVAWAIAYLASPLSASTTGTVLSVDGGFGGVRLPPRLDA
jgi:NAD(P)-dependent dehydrogenase (short-subunit alcohol dehydrogenase family)